MVTHSEATKYSHSTHFPAWRVQHKKIVEQNRRIAHRINTVKAHVDVQELAKQFHENRAHEKIARNGAPSLKKAAKKTKKKVRYMKGRLAVPKRERPPKSAVFCPELQRKLNPGTIPGNPREGNDGRFHYQSGSKPYTSSTKQKMMTEPAGIASRPKTAKKEREKLKGYTAWPEERPPRLHAHPGLGKSSDML